MNKASTPSLMQRMHDLPKTIRSTNVFVNPQKKLRNGWWIAIYFLLLASMLVPLSIWSRENGGAIAMWQQALISLIAAFVLQLLRRQPISEMFGRFDLNWLKDFGIGSLMGSVLMLLPALFLFVGGWVTWRAGTITSTELLSALMMCAAVAIAEEVVFRGVFLQRLKAGVGIWPAQIFVAAYFLLTHSANPGMDEHVRLLASVNIFLASILFGMTYLKTNSLAMPLALHMMANFVQGSILGFGVSGHNEAGLMQALLGAHPVWLTGGQFGLEASAPGLITVILFIALVAKRKSVELA
ncbi:lysostaphin resistance A-like protein [Undibacterium sp. Di24W]|uniref:CPBP family intramembrane glutamic endopeptidase n=1 Tax=Undibacterium sp. Di24W TaxID=3413033 RepID=UPI003BF1FC39